LDLYKVQSSLYQGGAENRETIWHISEPSSKCLNFANFLGKSTKEAPINHSTTAFLSDNRVNREIMVAFNKYNVLKMT